MKKILAFAFGWARVFRSAGRAIREARTEWAAARLIRGIRPTEALIAWDGKVIRVIIFGGRFVFEVRGEKMRMICETLGWVEGGEPAMRRLEIGHIAFPG